MNEKNNINTLFKKLEDLDVFDTEFSNNLQKTYSDFFHQDRSLVMEEPRELHLEDQDDLEDGRYYIDYKGAHFEAFFKRGNSAKQLIVTFSGARTSGGGKLLQNIPHFPRWSWSPFIDGSFLCFEDPMYYLYDDLNLGWFYGNENEDYAIYTAEVIREITEKLYLDIRNIILYGSSGGGAAAIRVGVYLPGSKVVAINPQLDICNHYQSKRFIEITGIDLLKKDLFNRNNPAELIQESRKTNFLLILNAEDRHDIEVQLKSFFEKSGYKDNLRYGLTKIDNLAIWIYDGPGKIPHNVQENYRIYPYIKYLLEAMDEEDFEENHRQEVMYINDWWRFQAQAAYEKQLIKEENEVLKKQREQLYKTRLQHVSNASASFDEKMTARIDIINSAFNSNGFNDLDWIAVSDTRARVQAPVWFIKNG